MHSPVVITLSIWGDQSPSRVSSQSVSNFTLTCESLRHSLKRFIARELHVFDIVDLGEALLSLLVKLRYWRGRKQYVPLQRQG